MDNVSVEKTKLDNIADSIAAADGGDNMPLDAMPGRIHALGANNVKYTPQELTPEQQEQVRQNIGAAPKGLGITGAAAGNLLRIKVVDSDGAPTEYAADIPNYVTPEMFGAKGDGLTDDTTPIQKALDRKCVVILAGKEYLVSALELKNCTVIADDNTILKVTGAGLIIRDHVNLSGGRIIKNEIAPGSIGVNLIGSYANLNSVKIAGFETGAMISGGVHNSLINCIAQYNQYAGFQIGKEGNGDVTNCALLEHCYAVKNGPDADLTETNGTRNSGYGYLVANSCNALCIKDCVAEYNTGFGYYYKMKQSANKFLLGAALLRPYSEGNKLAQVAIEPGWTVIRNCKIEKGYSYYAKGNVGNFIGDAAVLLTTLGGMTVLEDGANELFTDVNYQGSNLCNESTSYRIVDEGAKVAYESGVVKVKGDIVLADLPWKRAKVYAGIKYHFQFKIKPSQSAIGWTLIVVKPDGSAQEAYPHYTDGVFNGPLKAGQYNTIDFEITPVTDGNVGIRYYWNGSFQGGEQMLKDFRCFESSAFLYPPNA